MLAITGVQVAKPTFCCTNLVSCLVCKPREGHSICAQQSITEYVYKARFYFKIKERKGKIKKQPTLSHFNPFMKRLVQNLVTRICETFRTI